MTGASALPRRLARLTRRRLLLGAGATAVVGGGAGIRAGLGTGQPAVPDVPLGPQAAGLPARQHAWDAYLAVDADGNPVAPRFDRLLFFDVAGDSADGQFAGGTTMHVSYMRLRLDTWYAQLSQRERVARIYAPQVTPEQAATFTADAESDPNLLGQAITRYGRDRARPGLGPGPQRQGRSTSLPAKS